MRAIFLNKKIKTKQKNPQGFPGHELADPWKFGTPVSEGLAEVTDRAGAEPEQLGFIASICLSVCWSPAGLNLMKCRLTAGGASYKLTEKPHGV